MWLWWSGVNEWLGSVAAAPGHPSVGRQTAVGPPACTTYSRTCRSTCGCRTFLSPPGGSRRRTSCPYRSDLRRLLEKNKALTFFVNRVLFKWCCWNSYLHITTCKITPSLHKFVWTSQNRVKPSYLVLFIYLR